jgi:hypothetical protein
MPALGLATRLVPAQPSRILRAAIRHDPDREVDASYVAAALRAAAETLGRRLELDIAGSDKDLGQATEWLFHLSSEGFLVSSEGFLAPPPSLRILVEDRGSEPTQEAYTSFLSRRQIWIQAAYLLQDDQVQDDQAQDDQAQDDQALNSPIDRIRPTTSVWIDDKGRSVLEEWQEEDLLHISFRGRFHPQWTDLVERAAFPRWIAGLLRVQKTSRIDLRQAGEIQWLPSSSTLKPEPLLPDSPPAWIWIPVLLLFFSERLASWRSDAS